ncbi:uncharacterized protein Z520_01840 [Fonsecaea multimorphosa CBS 102226]|uniref:Integrase zinc-binding domain-containing protein n=1 Tax=Fonsecaea multimorphosa CBS 102226 TaxID=1442371 RepID=A0A0D2IXD0_9EURO|nr:uncharacterized protein Z520_01840 [Fonsecaea multimorphosa CBS 102226]KIY01702.1 hypothetical protein Z520_01840 [Fonsecaea multimorphosa CBS 102226]
MNCASQNAPATFSGSTKNAFLQHLRETPNRRRVSQSDRIALIEWLTNPYKRPASQEESSRRNYAQKTFSWDNETQSLLAVAKNRGDHARTVITTDMIADTVERVHENNGHAGWDATWKDVSNSYYGILRSDVIFLLKQCQLCSKDPSKRPKGSARTVDQTQQNSSSISDFLTMTREQTENINDPMLDLSKADTQGGGNILG